MNTDNKLLITFCVIAYNEEAFIGRLFENILEQIYDHRKMEIVFVDGMSTDKTRALMERFQKDHEAEFYRILVLDNPGKTLPCGWNVALKAYSGDAIVRVDAHAEITRDFVERSAAHINAGDAVCGGYRPNIFDEDTKWKRMLLAAESSMFGSSFSDFRRAGNDRKVTSVFHGCYRREVFEKVGFFNERLRRTEDNDMNYRIRAAGYNIWFHSDIVSYQHIRDSLGKMLKQKYGNGYWIARTVPVSPQCLSLFYFVPFVFVLGIIFTSILALCGCPLLAKMMWGAYGLFAIVSAVLSFVKEKQRSVYFIFLPVIFLLLHVSYGLGTLIGFCSLGKKS